MNKRILVFLAACSIAARAAQVANSPPLAKSTGVQGPQFSRSSSAPSGESTTPPPSGKILNPRTEGHTFAFEVKDPDAKLVDFRLSLQGPDAGTLSVTIPTPSRVYPEFRMKRTG